MLGTSRSQVKDRSGWGFLGNSWQKEGVGLTYGVRARTRIGEPEPPYSAKQNLDVGA